MSPRGTPLRRASVGVILVVVAYGCSSSPDTTDPVSACKSAINALCAKVFACYPNEAAQAYTSVSNCETVNSTGCTTGNTTCPAGTTYSASTAAQCVNDYSNESCTNVGNGVVPTSCSKLCT